MARIDTGLATTEQLQPGKRLPVVINGEKKYVETDDLVLTGAEKEQLSSTKVDAERQKLIQNMVRLVYDNAAAFIFETLQGVMPKRIWDSDDNKAHDTWLNQNGFETLQDGLTTVVRMKVDGNMRAVRTLVAHVDPEYEKEVELWVRKEMEASVA